MPGQAPVEEDARPRHPARAARSSASAFTLFTTSLIRILILARNISLDYFRIHRFFLKNELINVWFGTLVAPLVFVIDSAFSASKPPAWLLREEEP